MRALIRLAVAASLSALALSCGSTPVTPGGGGAVLALSSVSPSTLSTTGGATITILGSGFGADAAVSVDGLAIPGATVSGGTSITVTGPTHAAGASMIVVTSGGKTVSSVITFVAPSGTNLAPVISNIRTIGTRPNQPSLFADLNESVQLTATVTNVEGTSGLAYAWNVGAGTVTGTGSSVTWTLPALLTTTPAPVAATLTVTETFTENGVQHRNVASSSVLADVHDSQTEILAKGFQFLDRFSQSQYTTAQVMVDFATTCSGYASETSDVNDNRANYEELPGYSVTPLPPVQFKFAQSCVWTGFRPQRVVRGDACSAYRAHWIVRAIRDVNEDGVVIPKGTVVTTDGQDFITNVLQNGQWKLCGSDFLGDSNSTLVEPSGLTRTIPTLSGMAPGRIRRQ